jgi:hypothetical protein
MSQREWRIILLLMQAIQAPITLSTAEYFCAGKSDYADPSGRAV